MQRLSEYLSETRLPNKYVDIRRVDASTFTKDKCIFVKLNVMGKHYNYMFTLIKNVNEYTLEIKYTFDFYTYRKENSLKIVDKATPNRNTLFSIGKAWELAKAYLVENWSTYFPEDVKEINIGKVIFHNELKENDDRKSIRLIRSVFKSIFDGIKITFTVRKNRSSRDIEGVLSTPIYLKDKNS